MEVTMKNFTGKVAVITGAASGIGRAIADRCAKEGMKIVLADIEKKALAKAEQELKATGAATLAVATDVSIKSDMETLAQKTLERFGAVHLLFNNAGVGAGSLLWNSSLADWQWVMNVNLWGAIYATHIFVPIMLNQQTECHIVNTASRAGLESGPGIGIYRVSKHALVSLSETLYHELKMVNAQIGVSVLCPGYVRTQICDAERNRPEELRNPASEAENPASPGNIIAQFIRDAVQNGMDPKEVADKTFAAIQKEQFYILPDPTYKPAVQQRMEDILSERNPTFLVPAN
jgi:NAD(P)-dependent dehydrogenase (short-subunit alcohol dehydrogenase family)